jgi:hypothetical protein
MHTASKTLLAAAALAGTGLLATPASARTYVSVGIGAPLYPRYYAPRPVYYPGYYPGYYAPPVVYGGYYGPRPYYYGRPWRGYYHRGYYGRHWR